MGRGVGDVVGLARGEVVGDVAAEVGLRWVEEDGDEEENRDAEGDGIIHESDEFENTLANEIGLYFQTTSKLLRRNDLELITAARLDYHDQLKEEGLQFGPKFGLMYNPSPKHSWRITYGKAFNTPTTTSLFTNYYVQKYRIFDVYLRGNKDGTQYIRVDENTTITPPTYYDLEGNQYPCGNYNFNADTNFDGIFDQNDTPYTCLLYTSDAADE